MSPKQTQETQDNQKMTDADIAAQEAAAKEATAKLAAEMAAKQAEADAAEDAKRAEDELAADRARAEAEAAEAKAAAEAADAKAEADRQAEAAAKAEVDALPALTALNLSRLSYLERQITLLNSEGTRQGLIDELVQVYDMTGSVSDGDRVVLSMEGITIDPAEGMKNALDNWGSAARRAIAGIAVKAGTAEVAE